MKLTPQDASHVDQTVFHHLQKRFEAQRASLYDIGVAIPPAETYGVQKEMRLQRHEVTTARAE